MTDLLPFLVVGITSGSLYGLAGVGLVLTLRTAGMFNFAHGAIAAASAYVFYDLHHELSWPWPVALLACVGILGPAMGLSLERITRALAGSRPVLAIVATVGMLLFLQGLLTWHYSATTLEFPPFLPTDGPTIAGVRVQYAQMITVAVGACASAGLFVFLRRARTGRAMRAVVQDPDLVALTGMSPVRVRRTAWIIGCSFAALSGILIAPMVGRDPILLTLLVVQAFGAATIGAFSSLPATYLGGVAVGVAVAVTTKQVVGTPALAGLPDALPFLVLVVGLLVTPPRKLAVAAQRLSASSHRRPLSRNARVAGAAAALAAAALVPALAGVKLPVFTSAVVLAPVFLSMALLVWSSGQISLCHAVFVAVGATSFSHLTTGLGLPWAPALVLAGLAVVPVGALVAIPALRLSGIYLALATFGFGILMQRLVFRTGVLFGEDGFRAAPRPELWGLDGGDDRTYYFVALAVSVVCFVAVAAVVRGRIGRLLRALGDSPVALSTHGLSVLTTRLSVFCLSAFLAGIGGALGVSNSSQVSGDAFGPFLSLTWLAVLATCGTRLVASPVLAGLAIAVVPAYMPSWFDDYQTMVFGAAAVASAVIVGRGTRWGGQRTQERIKHPIIRRHPVRTPEVATA